MNIESKQVIVNNFIYTFLKNQPEEFLEKNGIDVCETCDGIGFPSNGFSWDGMTYCDDCEGIGFVGVIRQGLQVGESHYLCKECEGIGCKKCNFGGVVDWITHAMG